MLVVVGVAAIQERRGQQELAAAAGVETVQHLVMGLLHHQQIEVAVEAVQL
jgi:hypothetical protein